VQGIESLEPINQDAVVRQFALRVAGLARGGRLPRFVAAVGSDTELDAATKATVLEPARGETFLVAAEDHVRPTAYLHYDTWLQCGPRGRL